MEITILQQLSACRSSSGFHRDFSDRNKKYRGFMLPSSHTASLPSSSTTSRLAGPSLTVMRILGKSALTTDSIQDLFKPLKETTKPDDGQLYFDVTDCISSRNVILACRFPLSSCVSSPSARQRRSRWESIQPVPRCHQGQRAACISQHRSCRPSR